MKRSPVSPPLPAETSGPSFKWNVLIGILGEKCGIIELWKLLMEHISIWRKPWLWLKSPQVVKGLELSINHIKSKISCRHNWYIVSIPSCSLVCLIICSSRILIFINTSLRFGAILTIFISNNFFLINLAATSSYCSWIGWMIAVKMSNMYLINPVLSDLFRKVLTIKIGTKMDKSVHHIT